MYREHRAQRKLNKEVAKQLPNDLSKNAIEKRAERARKIYDLFNTIWVEKIQCVLYILYIFRIENFQVELGIITIEISDLKKMKFKKNHIMR